MACSLTPPAAGALDVRSRYSCVWRALLASPVRLGFIRVHVAMVVAFPLTVILDVASAILVVACSRHTKRELRARVQSLAQHVVGSLTCFGGNVETGHCFALAVGRLLAVAVPALLIQPSDGRPAVVFDPDPGKATKHSHYT